MKESLESLKFSPIAKVHSPFRDKVLIPRNSGLCPLIKAELHFDSKMIDRDFFKDLEGVSHLWVIFVFHQNKENQNKGVVRPPRLGGEKKIGTFATRSPYRPNPLGLSLVKLESVSQAELSIEVSGHDFLDETPVLDIKPYVHYADSRLDSRIAWLENSEIQRQKVNFLCSQNINPLHLKEIEQILSVYPSINPIGKVIKSYYRHYDLRWSQELSEIVVHQILEYF